MKKFFSSVLDAYRKYRNFKKQSRIYKTYKLFEYVFLGLFTAYFLTIAFPQYLFANQVSHGSFQVYARQPFDENIDRVLDSAEARLVRSPLYDESAARRVFLTDSHGLYYFLSNKSFRSFGNSVPLLDNILINRSDIAGDRVFMDRAVRNNRSLSGVIAHEVTHHFIRKKFGVWRSMFSIPTWKNEGYCEYVAGDTTISFADGVKLWQENPNDDSTYAYFKYHQMVKYLLDDEKISVEDMFDRDFDRKELEAKVFAKISAN
jgi:hypothetical protein